jgi:hypothetical protein
VGVDVNADYIEVARRRYGARIPGLELYAADIEQAGQLFAPVDFLYAALVLEYVDVLKALDFMRRHCVPNGVCAVIVQQPHALLARVSPSPYASLHALESSSRWVLPEQLRNDARRAGFRSEVTSSIEAPDGKRFAVEILRRVAVPVEREIHSSRIESPAL